VSRLAVVLHDRVTADAPPDQLDTLEQAQAVSQALESLGYRVRPLAVDRDLAGVETDLLRLAPSVVFNLVESVAGYGSLVHLPARLLEALAVPFTGCSSEALYLTTDKLQAKRRLRAAGLPTPDWLDPGSPPGDIFDDEGPWLVKSVCEEASIGLDEGALVNGRAELQHRLDASTRRYGGEWFAERYVDGREFNIGLLQGPDGPEVLPMAEICFQDYPAGMPRIVDYAAKWDPDSFGYAHSQRSFEQHATDLGLRERLAGLALECWDLFGLRGYARVDFRIDAGGQPWILEINANPCIAPDAGFTAAATRAGLKMHDVVARLLAAASPTLN